MPELTLPPLAAEGQQHTWHLYVLQLNLERLCIDRSRFVELLKQHQIGTSVHFIPLHLHPYYRETCGYRPEDFPAASAVFERIVSLPIDPKMTEADVQNVIDAVRESVRQYRR